MSLLTQLPTLDGVVPDGPLKDFLREIAKQILGLQISSSGWFGNGQLGNVVVAAPTTLGGVKQYRNFVLNTGVTLSVPQNQYLMILATGSIQIGGKIDAKGRISVPFQIPAIGGSKGSGSGGGGGGGGNGDPGDGGGVVDFAFLPFVTSGGVAGNRGDGGQPGNPAMAGTNGTTGTVGVLGDAILDVYAIAPVTLYMGGAPGVDGKRGGDGGAGDTGGSGMSTPGLGGTQGRGGSGGGGIFLAAPRIVITATAELDARGDDGTPAADDATVGGNGTVPDGSGAGGGGGASGGSGGGGGPLVFYSIAGGFNIDGGATLRTNGGAGGAGANGKAGGAPDGTGIAGAAGGNGAQGVAGSDGFLLTVTLPLSWRRCPPSVASRSASSSPASSRSTRSTPTRSRSSAMPSGSGSVSSRRIPARSSTSASGSATRSSASAPRRSVRKCAGVSGNWKKPSAPRTAMATAAIAVQTIASLEARSRGMNVSGITGSSLR